MNNCTIIIFGATGDLAKKKLFVGLYHLIAKQKITDVAIIGVAFTTTDVSSLMKDIRPLIDDHFDQSVWDFMHERFVYQQLDFNNEDDFVLLKEKVVTAEKKYNLSGNRLLYCASAAQFFIPITTHTVATGLMVKKDINDAVWHRIVYEKPFGHDLFSAHDINRCIAQRLNEHQIYRIDHYLTKEVVSNIALIRFANSVFEPLWNNRSIDQVHITLAEDFGIEKRGAYYDAYGALADVVQNHMLQLLALIGMEAPEQLSGDYVQTQRAKVLQSVSVIDGILGQYEGYANEYSVAAHSTTETFAYLVLHINNQRWSGVPFFLKTGKYLEKKETTIHIQFKQGDCLLAKECPPESNWLTIQVSPYATFSLTLNAKKPGSNIQLVPVAMEFCHHDVFKNHMTSAYEIVFEDVLHGQQTTAVRFDEIESAWNIIGMIKEKHFPLYSYTRGASGPQQLQQFMDMHGVHTKP